MANNFSCPIKGEQFKRDFELYEADLKRKGIAKTTDYKAYVARRAKKIRREAK